MQAAPARYVSASELYCADEVELLLDEIRELEPTSCRGEDVQDFEIAGSGGGGAGAGGRSPAGTELTERSWDSHAHYSRAPPPRPLALAPVYCRARYLLTPSGALTLLLAVVGLCVCGCVWGAAGLRAGAARPLLLGALTSLMLHATRALLHVTRLDALLPIDWNMLGGASFLWSALWLAGGAAALLLRLGPIDRPPGDVLFAAAVSAQCSVHGALLQGGASFLWSALWLAGGAAALLLRLGPIDRPPGDVLFAAAVSAQCSVHGALLQGGASFLWSALWLAGGAAALLLRLGPIDRPPGDVLFAAAMLGLSGACVALAGCGLSARAAFRRAHPPPEHAYRALPTAPPPPAHTAPQPSTSRDLPAL